MCERYELLDVLGKGAHGRIYLATDLVTHERVAIKLVSIFVLFMDITLELKHVNMYLSTNIFLTHSITSYMTFCVLI